MWMIYHCSFERHLQLKQHCVSTAYIAYLSALMHSWTLYCTKLLNIIITVREIAKHCTDVTTTRSVYTVCNNVLHAILECLTMTPFIFQTTQTKDPSLKDRTYIIIRRHPCIYGHCSSLQIVPPFMIITVVVRS